MYGYIYETTNLINNKKYIGKKKSDIFLNNEYLGSGSILNNAIKKYGKENFYVKLIDTADSLKELNYKEKKYISMFDAVKSDNYYNIASGGDGGVLWNSIENHPSKHTDRSGNKNPFYGKKHTDETKKKISEKNKNKKSKNKGKIRIRKDNIIKYINKECLDDYLKLGYTCYIKNKELEKQNKKNTKRHKTDYQKSIASKTHKNKVISDEQKLKYAETRKNWSLEKKNIFHDKQSSSQKELCWVCNKEKTIRINKKDLEKYLNEGFIRGRKYI